MARIVLVFCVVVTMSDATPLNIFQNTLNKIKQSINQVIGDKSTRADGKPWFCHELDCPEFKTVRKIEVKNDDGDDVTIEERCYPQTNWVKTSMDGSKDDDMSKYCTPFTNECLLFMMKIICFYCHCC